MKKILILILTFTTVILAIPILKNLVYVDLSTENITEEYITEQYNTINNNTMYYIGFYELDIDNHIVTFNTDYDYFFISYIYQYNDGFDSLILTGTALINSINQHLPIFYGNVMDPILSMQVTLNVSIELTLSPTYMFEYMYLSVFGGNYA